MRGLSFGASGFSVILFAFGFAGCLLPRYDKRPPDGGSQGQGGHGGSIAVMGAGGQGGQAVDSGAGDAGARDSAVADTGTAERPPPVVVDAGPGYCLSEEPVFSFLDGFESYPADPVGYVADAPGSPWRALAGATLVGQVSTTWVRSCSQNLYVQGSGHVVYVPLQISPRPSRLNIELLYAPETGTQKSAEFGLGSVSGSILTKAFSVVGQGTSLVVSTPSGTPAQIAANLETASDLMGHPPRNYIRVELDFCLLQARIFVGRDSSAALTQTVDLGDSGPFDAFYVSEAGRSTFIDDLAIWTPGTSFDRSNLCAAKLIETITSPSGTCSGIGWDGTDLWMIDNNQGLYRISDGTTVTVDFQGYGLSWDGSGFWTRNNSSASFGAQIVRVHKNGVVVDPGPNIFAQGGFSDSGAQGQWQSLDAFWTLSTSPTDTVQKWTNGRPGANWPVTDTFSASGILVKDDAIYLAVEISRGGIQDPDTGIYKYSLAGTLLKKENLWQLGLPAFQSRYSLASDGTTYWICSESGSDIYHVALPF